MADKNVQLQNNSGENLYPKTKLSICTNDAGFIKNTSGAFDYNNLANKPSGSGKKRYRHKIVFEEGFYVGQILTLIYVDDSPLSAEGYTYFQSEKMIPIVQGWLNARIESIELTPSGEPPGDGGDFERGLFLNNPSFETTPINQGQSDTLYLIQYSDSKNTISRIDMTDYFDGPQGYYTDTVTEL